MSVVYKPSNLRYLFFFFFSVLCWVFIATCWLSLVTLSGLLIAVASLVEYRL